MRRIAASVFLFVWLAAWIGAAATLGSRITEAPRLLQLVFYVVAGFGWVVPLKPVFAWMNRAAPQEED